MEGFIIELIDYYFKGEWLMEVYDVIRLGGGVYFSFLILCMGDIGVVEFEVLMFGMKFLLV